LCEREQGTGGGAAGGGGEVVVAAAPVGDRGAGDSGESGDVCGGDLLFVVGEPFAGVHMFTVHGVLFCAATGFVCCVHAEPGCGGGDRCVVREHGGVPELGPAPVDR